MIELLALAIGLCLLLLIFNVRLLVENMRLRHQMMARERWHQRELDKWKERI